ncbi:MAG: hypothetical protein OZSIB_0130 [Candidatus Ozemobacter sibiricus]|jgi:hypothetical protein|uniref:DUF2786 domain-containing protein n=1 Tax=Candidatus Ozemobacter sibiricus TaxID=2268124 RepID=A0A367ZNC4_9BACT|nr:MAG: hypothetical protein OZSIB_0130 [Candidatus Ozemobacter sibiricus]
MSDLQRLIEKIRKIQALYDGAATSGERAAALAALQRLQEGLGPAGQRYTAPPPPPPPRPAPETEIEYRFSLDNPWSRKLLRALLEKAGIRPYRRHGQRRTTVTARLKPSFCEGVLWPEFQKINALLNEYLEETADRVIAEAIGRFSPDDGME